MKKPPRLITLRAALFYSDYNRLFAAKNSRKCSLALSTFTNVLNHTNYAPPATNISSQASFGVLTAAQTAENAGNRTGQIALRLEF